MPDRLMIRTNGRPSLLAVLAGRRSWVEIRELAQLCDLDPLRVRELLDRMDIAEVQERLEGDRARVRPSAELDDATREVAQATLDRLGLL